MFGHVQLRGAAIPLVSSQLGTPPGPHPSSGSGHRPPAAEQGLGPGGLHWEGRALALSALLAQRPCQVECGGGL